MTLSGLHAAGQNADPNIIFEEDSYLRENPQIEYLSSYADMEIPDFINRDANEIILNGADWSTVIGKFNSIEPRTLSIVHIGDSHIQAEISTSLTRELLQLAYGSAGRGLVSPLRLSGTNQPLDYKIESTSRWDVDKVMKPQWKNTMGFNGISLTLMSRTGNLTVTTTDNDDFSDPFFEISVYHSGNLHIESVVDAFGRNITFRTATSDWGTKIMFAEPLTALRLDFSTQSSLTLHGLSLSGSRPGLFYHAIGNNGAAYATYNRIPGFSKGVATLSPDIIVLSLGTNEAFGKADITSFRHSVESLIDDLKKHNPGSMILVTTPMECQRRSRNRRQRRRSYTYAVNSTVETYRNELLSICREKNVAIYDWFKVAGGQGASTRWVDAKYMGSDRVHYTSAGYRLNGLLLYQALSELIDN